LASYTSIGAEVDWTWINWGPNEAALAERDLTQHYVGFVQCDILSCSAITVIVFVPRGPLAVPALVKLMQKRAYRVIEDEMGIPFLDFGSLIWIIRGTHIALQHFVTYI
jgi:hypothetical protein